MKSPIKNMAYWKAKNATPVKQKDESSGDGSFDDAFASARKKQGPGGTFEWRGNKYTTDRADDSKTTTRKDWIGHGPGRGGLKPGYPKMVEGKYIHKYFQKNK
jgi:hypothetical protein